MAKVLVVEDNPINMKLAVLLLENADHHVLQARDAESAIVLAHDELPDLVLMDIQLPGMDGLAAIRQLKEDSATQDIKIIAVTSFAMKSDKEKALAAGCNGYLAKPIQYETFMEKIEQILNGD